MVKRSLPMLLAGIFVLGSHALAGAKTYNPSNGHYYEVVTVSSGINWNQAKSAAAASGGYLATITSAAENDFVYNLAAKSTGCWFSYAGWGIGPLLGGYQQNKSHEPVGGWQWVTGEQWSYTNWAPGQPENALNIEDCLHFVGVNSSPGKLWNDIAFGSTCNGYVVEYNSVPEPSAMLTLISALSVMGGIAIRRRK